jgi:ribosomal protein L40E
MIIEEFDFVLFFAITLPFALLIVGIARRSHNPFKKHYVLTEKTCPKCAEQLPISALLCEACDYNFLSMSVVHRHKLLPAPQRAT